MTKTTITVDPETHSAALKLQSILTLMSGTKCSLSDTVNYSVNTTLNATSFAFGQQTSPQSAFTTSYCSTDPNATISTTSNTRFSLRQEK